MTNQMQCELLWRSGLFDVHCLLLQSERCDVHCNCGGLNYVIDAIVIVFAIVVAIHNISYVGNWCK